MDLPDATINWRLHEMEQNGSLQRIGRGKYRLPDKPVFNPETKSFQEMAAFIRGQFPLVKYCLWDTEIVRALAHHIPSRAFVIVEVEKDPLEEVYDKLKDKYDYVFLAKDYNQASGFLKKDVSAIFIKPLLSEAPVRILNGVPVPELEKILVDTHRDMDLFSFLEGKEWNNLWENALARYTVNTTRLLRYAARRGQRKFFYSLFHPGTVKND
ncbi:MAG: hypothetical protein JW904_09340 [Spirochaetales bacterium]|nr:hypothetical protein [Spirochaetales bacterium]